MSWQCPICETVNQDVTPVCTVCEHLAPVVDSYLSLESIENLREYNDKMEKVHTLEVDKDYNGMLELATQAIALCKDNRLAIEKVQDALKKLQYVNIEKKFTSILEDSLTKKNLTLSSGIIKIAETLDISNDTFEKMKKDVKKKISRKKEVDEILQKSYRAIIDLDTNMALQIVEEGLIIHSSSKRLKNRRNDIQNLIQHLNDQKEKTLKGTTPKPHIKPKHIPRVIESIDLNNAKTDKETISSKMRKFPKVKRNQ